MTKIGQCPKCGSFHRKQIRLDAGKSGKNPHYAKLYCLGCDRHIKWLSKADFESGIYINGEVSIDA